MSAASAEGLSQCWLISAVFFVPNCAAVALWLLPLAVLLTEFCVTLLHERVHVDPRDRKRPLPQGLRQVSRPLAIVGKKRRPLGPPWFEMHA